MIRNIILVLLFHVCILFANDKLKYPQIGKKAPEIKLEKILNKTDNSKISLSDLKGKIVILEFWATWCGPCIPAMDHLSKLQDKFKDNIQIIAISSEDEERLKKYLLKRPTNLWIGVDSNRSISDLYDPQEIPHSVIIDRNNIIIAITYPKEITESKIQKILIGEKTNFKEKKRYNSATETDKTNKIDKDTKFYISIKLSQSPITMSKLYAEGEFKDRRITATKFTIPMLYQFAYQLPSYKRIIYASKNPDQYEYKNAEKFDFDLIVPNTKKENLYKIMIRSLNIAFPINPKIENRKVKVKVLKLKSKGKLKLNEGLTTTFKFQGPNFEATNISIKKFAEYLENFTQLPVVDETNLTGKYDIKLNWQFEDPKTFQKELKRIGLELEDSERNLDLLIFPE